MPISNKDLGKYKRPGIFVEETNLSIVTLPIQDVLINLVPGFSKKGPFNKPVRVNSTQDFEAIYGPIDKNLENKGSFFHRTVNDMLSKGPIWALNLLKTDPNRDKLQWEAVSVAAQYDNGTKNLSPYERFFNRQDFWERDVESFMDIVDETYADDISQANPAHNLLSITNMGDKKFTVFTFKSNITGFDVTAENWYNGQDKVPLFMNPKDWISDYMISILSVIGDWTDYTALSVDTYWSKYFNSKGLIKSKIQDFVNDRLVNINAYYDACLIPNFRDVSGRDLYVKNVINNNTDKTGLFCYYNEDALLNADFYRGNIDLNGQTMVCTDTLTESCKKTIDFMSYKTSISEELTYIETPLDTLSNVFGNYDVAMSVAMVSGRTAQYTNWYTNVCPTGSSLAYAYNVDSTTLSAITLTATTYTSLTVNDVIYFNKSYGVIDYSTPYYVKDIVSNVITISKTKGGPVIGDLTAAPANTFIYSLKKTFSTIDSGLTYILNGTEYVLNSGSTNINLFFEPFVITNSAVTDGYSRKDIVYLSTDYSNIWTTKGTQVIGTGASKPNFLQSIENTIILGYMNIQYSLSGSTPVFTYTWYPTTVNENTGYKVLADTTDVLGLTGVTTDNINYLDIYFVGTMGSTSYSDYNKLRKTKIFNEIYTKLITNKSVIIDHLNGYKFPIISPTIYLPTTTTDGHIKIYFNPTLGSDTNPTNYYSSGKFIIYYIDNEFLFPDALTLNNFITTEKPLIGESTGIGIVAKYSTFYQNYYDGIINNGDYIYLNNDTGSTQKIFLKMWLDSNEKLTVAFSYDNVTTTPIVGWDETSINVYSDKESLKQTIEIESTSYITDFNNVTYIYVRNDRYGEIQKGYFLEAYYDVTYYTEGDGYLNGEFPRKLVRVTKVMLDTIDPTLKIIYADGPIKISSNVSGDTTDYYTTAYMSIDNYVTEYNGITLDPFVIHADSIPNGTDTRLDSIMSVIDKSTNLAKGLVNKNMISWRYMIDSFGLGLTTNSKQEYVDLCGAKLNCFGFINMPSARQFKTSVSPSFINDDRTINTGYIKDGGDLTKNPAYLYSFGEGVGTSTVGYFFPYVKDVNDTSKFVPPASKIAKAYMSKFTGELGASYPWQIIAGPQFSLMKDIQETEMKFTNEDLENFYAMGANPIVYTLNRGYNINSENSASVYPVSSLSYIHSREVLIELENRLYDMLLNYHWRFNTTEIRAEIKYRADQICKELVDTDALYDFKNVCDKTNNTDYIIDLQMGVLDTYVEIIKGMGIIVNNIVILKKGTIQSGGFLLT